MLGALRGACGTLTLERFQTQKTAALFAYLAFNTRRRHTREELIDMLWPDAPIDAARNRLSQAVGWLRPHLEPPGFPRGCVLQADRISLGIAPEAVEVDAHLFMRACRRPDDAPETEEAVDALVRAVQSYGGEFLPGMYEEWVLEERGRLAALYQTALRRLSARYSARQDWDEAAFFMRNAVAADPLDEQANLGLVRLLAQSGNAPAAVRHYREFEQLLERELAEKPSPRAAALLEEIRRIGVASPRQADPAPTSIAPAKPAAAPPLPAPLTRFVGREEPMRAVEALLTDSRARLVTLTGLGGVGKTRLALEIARHLQDRFTGGVWFAPLADLVDARHITEAVADLLGVRRHPAKPLMDQLVATFPTEPVLLVLDNLEHLIEGSAPVARTLLIRVPQLTILATSRRRLGVEGEREYPVPPLGSPGGGADAGKPEAAESVRLFVDRARAVRPSFAVSPQNEAAIARLCEQLEGLPLGIELCAEWAQTLTPAQIVEHLKRRFDLLVSSRPDLPARHRSLRAAIDSSFVLLSPELQRFFVRLSVFRGGWTLEAAAVVAAQSEEAPRGPMDALVNVTELRERSLILSEEAANDTMRYRMVETLREYAWEQLGPDELTELRNRHAAFFADMAAEMASDTLGGPLVSRAARLAAEIDNIRAALHWSRESGQPLLGLRLSVAAMPLWDFRGHLAEGQEWIEGFLGAAPPEPALTGALRARAYMVLSLIARERGDTGLAMEYARTAQRSAAEGNADLVAAEALRMVAVLEAFEDRYDEAERHLQEVVEFARAHDMRVLLEQALFNQANTAMELGRFEEAWALLEGCKEQRRRAGDEQHISDIIHNQALVARYRGELATARRMFTEALELKRQFHHEPAIAMPLLNLATLDRLEGRYEHARELLAQSAQIALAFGLRLVTTCVRELGFIALGERDYDTAARMLCATEQMRQAYSMNFRPADPDERDAAFAEIERHLGPGRLREIREADPQEAFRAFLATVQSAPASSP